MLLSAEWDLGRPAKAERGRIRDGSSQVPTHPTSLFLELELQEFRRNFQTSVELRCTKFQNSIGGRKERGQAAAAAAAAAAIVELA